MAKLEDLERALYEKSQEAELKSRMKSRVVFPKFRHRSGPYWQEEKRRTPAEKKSSSVRRLFPFLIGGLGLFFIIGAAAFVFFYIGSKGQEAQIVIPARDSVSAGEIITVPVSFTNTSRGRLTQVELAFLLPSGSLVSQNDGWRLAPQRIIQKIEDLEPGAEKTVEFTGRLFGREGEEKKVEAILLYQPETLRARFSARAVKIITIQGVPVALSWGLPQTVSRGQEMEMTLDYTSHASLPFDHLSVRVEYPPGFTFVSSDPVPSVGDMLWEVGTLDPARDGRIVVRGKITGDEGELKSFRAGIGVFDPGTKEWTPYTEAAGDVRIAVRPLLVEILAEGARDAIVKPGDELRVVVRYKNNTETIIRNVFVKVLLEGDIVDFQTLSIQKGGAFDAATRMIIWNPSTTEDIGSLEPGKEGELGFSIRTRARPAVRTADDKNVTVHIGARIEAATPPEEFQGADLTSQDDVWLKVQSKIIFAGRAVFRSSPIPGEGTLPPQVGKKTVYSVILEVRNFTNDLGDAEIIIPIPPNVKWVNSFSPPEARMFFDAATGRARWSIGEIKAGVGVRTPALAAAFQLALTPAEADVGKAVGLTGAIRFSATDRFTGEKREETISALTTELTQDSLTNFNDWRVVR